MSLPARLPGLYTQQPRCQQHVHARPINPCSTRCLKRAHVSCNAQPSHEQQESQGCNSLEEQRSESQYSASGSGRLSDGFSQVLAGVLSSLPAGAAFASEQGSDPQTSGVRKQRTKPRELAGLLGISEDAARVLTTREELLLYHPLSRLKAALQRLASTLKIDQRAASALAVRQPRVLLIPHDQLKPRLDDIQEMLKAPEPEVRGLVQQQPGLLTHQPDTLRARLMALARLMGLSKSPDLVTGVCRREPGLLALTHEQVAARLSELAGALTGDGSTGAGSEEPPLGPAVDLVLAAPTALLLPSSKVASKVATLATLLALPGPAAGDLLVLQPRLLTQAPETLAANLRGLGAALGVERETAAVLCAEHPSLLLLGAQGTEERLKTLSQVLSVSYERARELCATKPALLTKDPSAVKQAIATARKRGELPPQPK